MQIHIQINKNSINQINVSLLIISYIRFRTVKFIFVCVVNGHYNIVYICLQ